MSEIDILKAVIEDLKDDNKILKQTLLQAQKEYGENKLTVRDHFAGLAMQVAWEHIKHIETLAKQSYEIADAMIAERDKR